jgi:uncharacterized phage-associated protein
MAPVLEESTTAQAACVVDRADSTSFGSVLFGAEGFSSSIESGTSWVSEPVVATVAMTDRDIDSVDAYPADNNAITPQDIAAYFLMRSAFDGDLITPLKMQKLVYYAYAWTLAIEHTRLFQDKFQAWPNGPVIPDLYQQLKRYGASPIAIDFAGVGNESVQKQLMDKIPVAVRDVLDEVYETYMPLTAFELVSLTHNELPWKNARKDVAPTERSDNYITDEDILKQYIPTTDGENK